MTGSAAKGPESTKLQVAPDLDQRLARYREIQMPFHSAGLTTSEKELVEKLVDASRYLEEIYLAAERSRGFDALRVSGCK